MADVVPHRHDTGTRVFVPVTEVAEALGADLDSDPASWLAELGRTDDFGDDQPTDPFDPAQR